MTGAEKDNEEESKSPGQRSKKEKADEYQIVLNDDKDDLVEEDVDKQLEALEHDPNAITGSKGKQEVDEFGIADEGEWMSPVDFLLPGYIDIARLSAGTCVGTKSL